MATYTVRLEHGRRRDHADLAIPADGPVSPAYLQHPVDVSHVQVHVDDHDAQGRPRPGIEMDNEARWTATMMHADQPGRPTDMVTKADIVRMEASLPTRPDPAENGSHERTAGKGKPRHDAPDVDRRAGAPGADEAAAVAQDSGRDRDGQGARGPEAQGQELRPLAEHPKLDSDLSRLPKAVRQNYRLRVDDLRRGIPHSSTHPLHGPLKGWHATSIGGTNQFRVVHRYAGDSLQVLSAGNHDEAYDAGIRREAADRGFSEHNRFLERLDKGPEDEPYLAGRRDEYAKDVTTHTGHRYTLLTDGPGFGGNTQVTAHRRLSNGKYQGVGYLSWFGGNPEREGREGNVSPGRIYKVHVAEQHRRRGVASAMLDFARERYPHMNIRHSDALTEDGRAWAEKKAMQVKEYEGTVGNRDHITRSEIGMLPIDVVRNMRGGRGEIPGEHRNRQGQDWEDFKADVAEHGVKNPIFITVDHGEEPKLSEGSHRRDAAVELGHSHIPAEIRYFGHAEQEGTVQERAQRRQAALRMTASASWDAGDRPSGTPEDRALMRQHGFVVHPRPDDDDDFLGHFEQGDPDFAELSIKHLPKNEPIHTIQQHVHRPALDHYLRHGVDGPSLSGEHEALYGGPFGHTERYQKAFPPHGIPPHLPIIATIGGKSWVSQGHHRILASRMWGEGSIPYWHHDIDKELRDHETWLMSRNPGMTRDEAAEFGGTRDALAPRTGGTRFTPTRRVFSHTCGLDHRLWDADGQLKPDVRRYILKSISTMWAGEYRAWAKWARVYFAGSEASEWTSDTLEGNNDFDVLVGVDYRAFRQANPRYAHVSNQRITDEMNHGFRTWNAEVMIVVDGTPTGPWDRTTYVNPDSYDIRKIKPYAAYDVTKDEWVVPPPHLPHWSIDDFPKPVIRALRAADAYAHSVLKLPEPERTQQGAALFDAWHSDRSRAFSERGEGWFDIANLREKWLDQEGVWAELVNCKHRADEGLDKALPTWSNTPPGYVAAKLPKTQKCKYCAQQATQRVIHSEGMAYIPACDEHLGKAKDAAARCTPDGSVDPSNVNAVRKIASVDDDDEEVEAGYLTPEHYKKLTFTDFPGRDISYVHQALTHREPNYMRHLTNDVIRNGVKHPIEIAHHDNDEWEVGGGHHRAAAAWKLGKPAPYVRTAEHGDFDPGEEYYRDNTSWRNRRKAHPKEEQAYMRRGEADDPFKGKWASLQVKEYDGEVGNRNHITRGEVGELPIDAVRHMRGARGEVPGEHRNRQGQDWENFKADVAANGIRNPIFITVDHNQEPVLNEGSHRRDAAVELGHSHIPAEIRYFGHAEHQGTVEERASRQSKTAVTVPYIRNNGGMRHVPGFGQDVEPWGRYMSPHDGHVPEGWEHGEVDFANPLRMEHDFGGWKQKLSDYHDGLTGKDLSAALLAKGHDAVITHDEHGPVEMVDLRPRGQRTHRPFEGALRTVVANDRLHRAWGSNDASTLFGDAPTTSVPFPSAGRRKDVKDYDPDLVRETLLHPEHHHMQEIDPRTLRATQPSITRGGVEHYMSGHYDRTGETYADQHNAGNRRPFVYQREDGQNLLLSGHHRAVSALLKGRPLQAIVVNGPWGPPRRPGR